jgi:hypothetical protein
MFIIDYIVILNGIYDIICALSILQIVHLPFFSTIHFNLIKINYKTNHILKRFFAYWIFTYGMIRLSNSFLIPYSYYIEAIFFIHELFYNSLHFFPTLFVIISSFLIGICYQVIHSM